MDEYRKSEHEARKHAAALIEQLKAIDLKTLAELTFTTHADAPGGEFKNQFQKDPWSDRARQQGPIKEE